MVRYIDIDGTICETEGLEYELAKPIKEKIDRVNEWFAAGDTIVYWTARGMASDDIERKSKLFWMTFNQLTTWGCKFHTLRIDKPLFDILYDDRAREEIQ